jgi:hypothetical protein
MLRLPIPEHNIDNRIRDRSTEGNIYHALFQNIRNYKRNGSN